MTEKSYQTAQFSFHPALPPPHATAIPLPPFPLEGKVEKLLHGTTPGKRPPLAPTRDHYFDLMEPIVRLATRWVNDDGAVIDPVLHVEWGQTSPRFAAAAAILLAAGRLSEHRELVFRVMDRACARLSAPDTLHSSPDFWMRELVTACTVLTRVAPPERLREWRTKLAAVIPEKHYREVDPTGGKIADFNNWCLYSAAGESMRAAIGIGGVPETLYGTAFFERYFEAQLMHFTEYGMYRDPGDPITYDLATRLQLTAALAWGYDGRLASTVSELLRRGALTMLLFLAPEGWVPYGGRSSQFQFQEAIAAALCEYEARRYRDRHPALAGAFKRQARRCAEVLRPYLQAAPLPFHIKNFFNPTALHGCDSYGQYSVYSLFAASVLGLAALFADDTIPEAPTPAETGGYSLYLRGPFHKIFVSAANNYLQYDTAADHWYDATGLGRILLAGMPFGLLPAMPFAACPRYKIAAELPGNSACHAVIPEIRDARGTMIRMADLDDEIQLQVKECEAAPDRVRLQLCRTLEKITCREEWLLEPGRIRLQYELTGPCNAAMLPFPILLDDGRHLPAVRIQGTEMELFMAGKTLRVRSSTAPIPGETATNRNGIYRIYRFPFPEDRKLTLELLFEPVFP